MSFSEWKEYILGDIATFSYGKMPKKELLGIGIYPVFSGYKYQYKYPEVNCRKGNLIIVARGVGGTGDVKLVKEDCYLTNLSIKISLNEKIALNKFIFYNYFLTTLRYLDSGSAISQITIDDLKRLKIILPKMSIQKDICEVLSSLDDKIEINRQINQTLEAIAQTLFKEMCVPPSDELPEGWKILQLNEVLEIKYGKDHKHLENGTIPLYGSGGIMRFVNKSLYEKESILIPRKGTLSNLFYINKPFWSVDTMFYTKIKDSTHAKFLFLLLKSMNLADMNVGSAVPSLTTEILNQIKIIIPSASILKAFDDVVTPFFEMLEVNERENKTLIAVRDGLLPKLMKREIEVNISNI